MKVTVLIDKGGRVIAAHVPISPEASPEDARDGGARVRMSAPDEHRVMILDVPDEDAPGQPPPDLLDRLQRHKDAAESGQ